jgi:hypothetical protein
MNANEENKLSMYEAVYDFGQDPAWAALIATVPDVANGFTQVGYLLQPIIGPVGASTKHTTSRAQSKGATVNKTTRRKNLAAITMAVAGPLSALGASLNDAEIVAVADTSAPKLLKLRDGILGSRARSIHTLAVPNAAALAPKGVGTTDLTNLDNAIGDWEANVQRPRQQAAAATGQATVISDSLKALDDFVKKQLDKLMIPFKTKAPAFHASYLASRVIHDTAGKKKTPPATPTP